MATELANRRGGRSTKTWLLTGALACVLALVATLLVVLRGTAGTDPFARLRPLDPRVEVRAAGEGDYALGTTDQQLQVGDVVRTDPQGRCEIAYHEGSLTRLGPDAVFELAELTDAPALHLRLEVGQLWQRVARLTGTEGSFRLHTPAATATVAGTVFATDCTPEGACTFTVIEGRLQLTTTTGEELILEAGEQVTIAPGRTPGDTQQLTEDDLWADAWIAYNLERDGESPPREPTPGSTPVLEPEATERPETRRDLIAFASTRDGGPAIYTAPVDQPDDWTRLTRGESPVWSPGGERIAFTRAISDEADAETEIWVMNRDDSEQRRLASGTSPRWSPDGSRIAFVSRKPQGSEIWVMEADGSNARRWTQGSTPKRGRTSLSWGPDGEQITFARTMGSGTEEDPNCGEVLVAREGAPPRTLVRTGPVLGFDWSPGGGLIAFVTEAEGYRGNVHCSGPHGGWIVNVETGERNELVPDNVPYSIAWAPDGQTLLFHDAWTDGPGWSGRIWTVRRDGTGVRRLFEPTEEERCGANVVCHYNPAWAPDGTAFLYYSRSSPSDVGRDLWIAESDGTDRRLLITDVVGADWRPRGVS